MGHSIDLVGHIVFEHKSGTEPTNGKQQIFSSPQGHIVFQSKSGTEPTNGKQQVLLTPQVIYYFKVSWGPNQQLASDKHRRP